VTECPQLWVFAGPNGAGKSTLVARFHVADRMTLVNPDTIARQIKPDHRDDTATMLKAGRIAAMQRRALIQAGQSFAMETTLTGQSELRMMADAQAAGYKITLVYVGLADALTSLARVRERVARGGHDVPAAIIMRRYKKKSGQPAGCHRSCRPHLHSRQHQRPPQAACHDRARPNQASKPAHASVGKGCISRCPVIHVTDGATLIRPMSCMGARVFPKRDG
jgi:predicted ABC-type ATPase